jgi:hypothetical protein
MDLGHEEGRMHRTNALVVATLLVMIAPLSANAAHAAGFEDMISPLSMPTVNEDPRPTTEIRPMYMYTKISDAFLTRGGHYHVVAIQLRAALTDRIGFIATKDGYIVLRPACRTTPASRTSPSASRVCSMRTPNGRSC